MFGEKHAYLKENPGSTPGAGSGRKTDSHFQPLFKVLRPACLRLGAGNPLGGRKNIMMIFVALISFVAGGFFGMLLTALLIASREDKDK